jgi:hypothetical protein
LATFT